MLATPRRHVCQKIPRETLCRFRRDALALLVDARVGIEHLFVGQQLAARIGAVAAVGAGHVAEGKVLGDTTTLADPTVLASIKQQYEGSE